jgi:hypothetical protein
VAVACKLFMTPYELTNDQKRYFGLSLVADSWDRQQLSDTICVYFDGDKIVKILNHYLGYFEYDTDIDTKDRHILLPKTHKGKEQKLTVPRILKIKGAPAFPSPVHSKVEAFMFTGSRDADAKALGKSMRKGS